MTTVDPDDLPLAGLRVVEVASFESPRLHGVSNLRTFRDGSRALRMILRERRELTRARGALGVPRPRVASSPAPPTRLVLNGDTAVGQRVAEREPELLIAPTRTGAGTRAGTAPVEVADIAAAVEVADAVDDVVGVAAHGAPRRRSVAAGTVLNDAKG